MYHESLYIVLRGPNMVKCNTIWKRVGAIQKEKETHAYFENTNNKNNLSDLGHLLISHARKCM